MPEPTEPPHPDEPVVPGRSAEPQRSRAPDGHREGAAPAGSTTGGFDTVEPADEAHRPGRSWPRPPSPQRGVVIDMPLVSGPPPSRSAGEGRAGADAAPARRAQGTPEPVSPVLGAADPDPPAPAPDARPGDGAAGHRRSYDDLLDEGLVGRGHGEPGVARPAGPPPAAGRPGYPGSGPPPAVPRDPGPPTGEGPPGPRGDGGPPSHPVEAPAGTGTARNGYPGNGPAGNGRAGNGHTGNGHAGNGHAGDERTGGRRAAGRRPGPVPGHGQAPPGAPRHGASPHGAPRHGRPAGWAVAVGGPPPGERPRPPRAEAPRRGPSGAPAGPDAAGPDPAVRGPAGPDPAAAGRPSWAGSDRRWPGRAAVPPEPDAPTSPHIPLPPPRGARSPYEIVPTPARGIPPVRPVLPPPADPGTPVPPADAPDDPVHVAYRVPVRGSLAGIHVEQLVVWQAVVLAALTLRDAEPDVLVPAAVAAAVLLGLTATRRRGQWFHRYLLHRLHLRRRTRAAAAADAPPPLTVQDARLGRRRRLATVFDGKGWSGAIRVDAGGPDGALPLASLVRAAERFLDDVEHDFADVQIVHTLVPAGRTARTRSAAGVQDRELPALVAQTWMTCRVHCVDGRRSDRPVPDLLEVRRDLRRAIDGVLGNLVEEGVEASALATRPLYDDCVFSAGGRRDGPEPVALPVEPASSEVERRPAAAVARSAGRSDEGPQECAAVEIDYSSDLGDSVHAALVLDHWPDEGFTGWLDSLSRVPARAVSLVVTLERSTQPGVEAGVAVRHTTGSAGESAQVDRALRELAARSGVGLRRADTGSHESLLATLPLGSAAAHRLLGPTTRHLVEPGTDAELRPRVAGVSIGHDRDGVPVPVPLVGPEPRWTAVLGGVEIGAAVVAAALAGRLPVQVVTPEPALWHRAFDRQESAERLDLQPVLADQPPPAPRAAPGLLLLDDYGAQDVVRPALRPWQGGVFRLDGASTDIEGLLLGVTRVVAVRCGDEQARAVCAALGLDEADAARLVTAPDGVVTVASRHGTVHVELDAALLARLGLRVTRPAAPARTVRGPMMVG